ncbi:MAG: NAD(P)H-hydrate epimerase [Tissierellia bacterium]|nr:NAD(P)H-hydrate epimerase [Tissierellia bacterium]
MLILSREEMQAADRRMIEEIGVPGIVLMEHAALKLQEHTRENALILCGSGNNGGDGLALARLLHLDNKKPLVLLMASRELKGDALINLKAAINLGVNIRIFYEDFSYITEAIKNASMVVDCLFGTGLTRNIKAPYSRAIERINKSGLYILSADLPSGIDANTGEVLGIAIKASKTISFHAMKKGMTEHPNVFVVDIGIEGYQD